MAGFTSPDTISFTPYLHLARLRASSFHNPIPLISSSTCLLNVFRGRPRFSLTLHIGTFSSLFLPHHPYFSRIILISPAHPYFSRIILISPASSLFLPLILICPASSLFLPLILISPAHPYFSRIILISPAPIKRKQQQHKLSFEFVQFMRVMQICCGEFVRSGR